MYNIFIEGTQGSGKSTLLEAISKRMPDYSVFREGDITPLELAWCSYMTESQYSQALEKFPEMSEIIESMSRRDDGHVITAYTKIETQNRTFYEYMERREIYGGRRRIDEFCEIVKRRFNNFKSGKNIFECALYQNVVEDLILFAEFTDGQIKDFYRDIFAGMDISKLKLIRLIPMNLKEAISQIKLERVDAEGNEKWYSLMMDYLCRSPYGKKHGFNCFEDLLAHLKHRIEVEDELTTLLPDECCLKLTAKAYELDDVIKWLQ